jgi:VIT1/CCC1 family predicted Fe2+/Mn2+ transporter
MRVTEMKHSLKVGLSFGLTSGIITTLGLMMGLYSGTHSKFVVIGGILVIAIADSFSDALGIHISEESENKHTTKEIWESTFSTFFFKFIVASSFIFPVILIELKTAIYISIIWGLSLLSILSFNIAKDQKTKSLVVVLEHLIIAVLVIILTYYVGYYINLRFG